MIQTPKYADRWDMMQELFFLRHADTGQSLPVRKPQLRDVQELALNVLMSREIDSFETHVVGSFTEHPGKAKDVDLVLRPKAGVKITTKLLERVLLSIQFFGIRILKIPVDVSYRRISEAELFHRNEQDLSFYTWKLSSPKWETQIRRGDYSGRIRRIGEFLIVIDRKLSETSYYKKLPLNGRKGKERHSLREAIALEAYLP